jgi:hypothetical protein
MSQRYFFGLLALALAGCSEVRDGFTPVLGDNVTEAEKERFARRLYLDLTGLPATDAQTKAVVDKLAEGNTPEVRDAVAKGLVESPDLAKLYVSETENAAFSGQSFEAGYAFVCGIVRGTDVACLSCADPDPCTCSCPALTALSAERQSVRDLTDDFVAGSGVVTSDVDRAFADTVAFQFNGTSPDGIATQLFQAFLGRPAEKDEQKNARFMIIGSIIPESPAGLLFHRHGAKYDDLLDIVFTSEVYREAMVGRVFGRYLGRRPTPDELRHFSATLDEDHPDLRPIIRAVVTSDEYFHQ